MARLLPTTLLPTSLLPPAIALACKPCLRATEPFLISRRARLWISVAVGMLLIAATAGADSHPAQAQTVDCVREPTGQAPDGTHWVGHWEINNYRRCWVLVDAAGREVAGPVPAQPANPAQSAWQPFLGDFSGASTSQPQAVPASPAAASPRRPRSQPDGPHLLATTSKPAHSEPPKSEVHPVTPDDKSRRDALYAEFLKSVAHPVKPGKSQPDRDALYAEFLEFLRLREVQKLTGVK